MGLIRQTYLLRICPDGRLSAKNMCPSISGQGWDHPRTFGILPHTRAGTGPRPYQNRQNFPGEFTLQSMIPQWKGCEKAGVPKNPRSVSLVLPVIPYRSLKKRCCYFLRRVKNPSNRTLGTEKRNLFMKCLWNERNIIGLTSK